MYSYGTPHMAEQKHDSLLEHTYNSYVRIRDVALKTCQRRWMIGMEWRERVKDIRAGGTMMMMMISSQVGKVFCIIVSFFFLFSGSFVEVLASSEYLTRWTAQIFHSLMRFLQYSLVSISFLVLLRYCFHNVFFHLFWFSPLPIFQFMCKFT